MTRIDGEKTYIKDAVAAIASEQGLTKRQVSKLAHVYHKQNFQEVVSEAEEFQMLYQKVTASK